MKKIIDTVEFEHSYYHTIETFQREKDGKLELDVNPIELVNKVKLKFINGCGDCIHEEIRDKDLLRSINYKFIKEEKGE